MGRYDRQYDFGLRGYRDTTRPMMDDRYRGARPGYGGYGRDFDERAAPEMRRANRVTARYNMDYVTGHTGSPYDRNYRMYTGDRPGRMGDDRMMRRPYWTTGGSRTLRGSSYPTGYDFPDYGPSYGGRYPDEL